MLVISERKLATACIILSTVGIAVLFVISTTVLPDALTPAEAVESPSGTRTTVTGFVDSVSPSGGRVEITIFALQKLDAVSFDGELISQLNLHRLQQVELVGELREFNGRKPLIISRIRPANTTLGCDTMR